MMMDKNQCVRWIDTLDGDASYLIPRGFPVPRQGETVRLYRVKQKGPRKESHRKRVRRVLRVEWSYEHFEGPDNQDELPGRTSLFCLVYLGRKL